MKYKFEKNISDALALNFLDGFAKSCKDLPSTSFIQSPFWSELQCEIGLEAFSLSAVTEGEEVVGIAFCTVIRAKRGKYLYVRNGPVLDWNNTELAAQFINHLKAVAKTLGLWFIRISPLVGQDSNYTNFIKSLGGLDCPVSEVEALDTRILDLELSEEDLLISVKKKTRYLIRQAEKSFELKSEVYFDNSKFEEFYSIFQETVERKKWNSLSYNYIKKEFNVFAKNNAAYMVLIKQGEKYVSGGIFIKFLNQAVYHYGASTSLSEKVPLAYLMLWKAILTAKQENCDFFNYWGVSPENKPNHPWFGLSLFKRKFPGFDQHWHTAQDIPVSYKYLFTNFIDKVDKKRKGY